MFQSFENHADPSQGPARLGELRACLRAENLDGFIIPRADAHQGEYVADADKRLEWLTGFTGSAGFCIALNDMAGVFIDGRYRNQVRKQVDLAAFTPVHWPETQPGPWLVEFLPKGGKVGFDPWLHTSTEIKQIEATLKDTNIRLVPCANLIDTIWNDRPAPPHGRIVPHPIEFAGVSSKTKRLDLAQTLRDANLSATVLTLPDSICWLLNIRGSDIERAPFVLGFAILHDDARVDLFTDPAKYSPELHSYLGSDIGLHPAKQFGPALQELVGNIGVDKATAPVWVAMRIQNPVSFEDYSRFNSENPQKTYSSPNRKWFSDPCALPKACKNDIEIAGSIQAHLRDGAAMVEFLTWFDATAAQTTLSEIELVTELEARRASGNTLKDISFETIAGSGPNGAIMHYRVTEDSDRMLSDGDLVVLDSGGQYLDGTTDITRTLPVGTVGNDEKVCFTRVLQGMIAISRLRWPVGLAGQHLDAIARYPLWLAHQDFNHGTGHGVGSYLSVHEGPQRLSRVSDVTFLPGMILSNEPGYYRDGAFGIRIENLIVVREATRPEGGDARDMLCFETLTFVPIDRRLIVVEMLSTDELDWLNTYHQDCLEKLAERVSADAQAWLTAACAPI